MVKKKPVKKKKLKKEKKKLTQKQKQNRQIMWAVILMAIILLIVLFVPFIIKNYINKFVYINLDFQKTQLGDMIFYSTRVPITDKAGGIVAEYVMGYNKNDPRDLKYINVSLQGKLVEFEKNKTVYLSLNPEMEVCEDNVIALVNLASFLRDFALLEVKSATTDRGYAEMNDMNYATCEYHPLNTVIIINSGNETKIERTNNNCYELTYNNCEITQVTEKFYWTILEHYMGYFVRR